MARFQPAQLIVAIAAGALAIGGLACSPQASSSAPGAPPGRAGAPAVSYAQPAAGSVETSSSTSAVQVAPPTAPAPPAVARPAASQPAAPEQPRAALSTAPQDAAASAASQQPFDRMVIRTAQLSLRVPDVQRALDEVGRIAREADGIISGSNIRTEKTGDQERVIADLTLMVRSDALETTLRSLRGLGKVETETSASQDVTEEYVDLDSNLRNLQATEQAILKLMDKAQRIEDVISLQRELSNVRGQIERIQGRKRYLERRSDMATVSLSLRLPPAEPGPLVGGGWDPLAVARRGWEASLGLLRGAAEVVIVVAAFSWWLVPLGALGTYVWLHRRRGRAEAAGSA